MSTILLFDGRRRLQRAVMVLALLLAGQAMAVRAQTLDPFGPALPSLSQYKVDRWQAEQGLPMNTVQALLQARDGRLWVGTGGGLAHFDGSRFADAGAPAVEELAARPVFGFLEAADGSVWIGHIRGAARWHQGRFEPVIGAELTAGRRVWSFAQGTDGAIWAASENGLVRWQDGHTRLYQEADGLPTRRLRSLAFDRDGTLWIGTTGGGLVTMVDGRFTAFDPAGGFPHREVRQVLADPDGGVWAATAGGGLAHVQAGRLRTYTVADGLPTDHLTALARDADGALWIGTWGGGISRFSEGRFATLGSSSGELDGQHIWSLHVDAENSVWVGTWHGGLHRLGRRDFGVFGRPEGLSGDTVRAVLHARDGAAWVSMAGGGVNRLEGGRITPLGRTQGLPTDEASTLFEDSDGALWVATYTEGVVRVQEGRIERFGVAQGLPHADVRVLYRDREGVLWAGTSAGLSRFDGRRFHAVREAGAPADGVYAILQDRQGTLWFGSAGSGLLRLRDGRFDALTRDQGLPSNWIMALHEDADGALWIGTNGEGLVRLREGRLRAIRPADGLWDGLVQVILEDRAGNLWFTSNRGFFRAARAELDAFADGRIGRIVSTGYGPGDALRATTFAGGLQAAGAIDARGLLWLPSVKGLVIVDPRRLPDAAAPPAVTLEAVTVGGVRGPPPAAVVLPSGAVPLSIHYRAGTLLHADRVRFRHRLEGLHGDWVDAGRHRDARYAALPHGQYRFVVAASIDGIHWREAAQPLPITVEPRLAETLWARVVAVLGLLAAGTGLWRLRTRHLQHRQAELARQVAEQTEALRLANEHLSRLSFADALTGLPNRRRLDEVLDTEWRRAQRLRSPLAVVMADIDAFKAYNDSRGHPEADRCLAAIADVIRRCTHRAGDFAARYGGEEFMVLLPGCDAAAAAAFGERLRQACEGEAIPHPASPVAEVVTISVGVASRVPGPGDSAMALVAEADAALYRAKQDGRNRVR